ncbi:hypothetical protein [Flagellimonas lutimaris]|uniref:hypothetical protein n=1 Tax=Flagellimonas lutimaris TaxID=475082 RepID=UPI003F5CD72D
MLQLLFQTTSPNWFDFLSLAVTVLSILGAYWIAENVYSREKGDKKVEDISLQYSENELFKNNLKSILQPISNQIDAIESYLGKKDFKMKFYPEIQVDFLQFVSIKDIYRKHGFNDKEKIQDINKLMTSLYSLYDFRESLRSEIRTYIEKYNYHEEKFYSYRLLLYTRYFELCNKRSIDIKFEDGIKKWSFNAEDKFMTDYSKLTLDAFHDEEIMSNNVLINRNKLIEKFVEPLSVISAKYIPEDYNAIEINEISNEVIAAFQDMEYITSKHFEVLNGFIESLNIVKEKINSFLN